MVAWEAEGDAAIDLINVQPTSQAGLMALLQYAITSDEDGERWPPELLSDDGTKTRSWHYFLIENVLASTADGVSVMSLPKKVDA